MKQKLTELKGEVDSSIKVVEDFNILIPNNKATGREVRKQKI